MNALAVVALLFAVFGNGLTAPQYEEQNISIDSSSSSGINLSGPDTIDAMSGGDDSMMTFLMSSMMEELVDGLTEQITSTYSQLSSEIMELRQENSDLKARLERFEQTFTEEKESLEQRIASVEGLVLRPVTEQFMTSKGSYLVTLPPSTSQEPWWKTSTLPPVPPTTQGPMPSTRVLEYPESEFVISPEDISNRKYSSNVLTTSVLAVDDRGCVLINDRENSGYIHLFNQTNKLDTLSYYSKPWTIARMHDDSTFAVTFEDDQSVAIFTIVGESLQKSHTIDASADYGGICAGPDNGTMFVSKWKLTSTARIDLINNNGEVVRTVLADHPDLIDPFCLQTYGDYLYVSDWTSQRFFRVHIQTGEVNWQMGKLNLRDLRLETPRNFVLDRDGTVYLATAGQQCNPDVGGSACILRITQSGDVSALLGAPAQHIGWAKMGVYPYGVDVTATRLYMTIASWDYEWRSEVASYPLHSEETWTPVPPVETTTPSYSSTPYWWY